MTTPASILQTPIPNRLYGQVALITGAGGNIGLETASRFLQEGAKVVLVDIKPASLDNALQHLKTRINLPEGSTAETHILCLEADVTDGADVKRFCEKTVEKFGRLDTAFLCAGISHASTSIFDTSEETYDKVMQVNCRSGKFLLEPHIFVQILQINSQYRSTC